VNVAIVVPVYNGVDYVGNAIDSVLAQTYEKFELVVVDGGSTDGTPRVVRSYSDPRITLVENDEDRGICASRNQGVQCVDSELVAFLDHDDIWHPEKLQRHVDRHHRSRADLVYSDIRAIEADGTVIGNAVRPDPESPGEPLVRQLLLEDGVVILTMSSVTIRRSVWETVGGQDPDYHVSGDADLYVRLAESHAFDRIAEPLVEKRNHDGNVSDRYRQMYRAHGKLVERSIDRYDFLTDRDERRCRARRAYHRATSALESGESNEALAYGLETLRFEYRTRAVGVVLLGMLDWMTGPLSAGTRFFAAYDGRTSE
jgi:glycosyltransferase involved in cell wall biosynthesis